MASIDADELIFLIVKTVPRQHFVGVRNRHSFECGIVKYGSRRIRQILFAKEPVVVERKSSPGRTRAGLRVSERIKVRDQREPGNSRSAALEKMSTTEFLVVSHDWYLCHALFRRRTCAAIAAAKNSAG